MKLLLVAAIYSTGHAPAVAVAAAAAAGELLPRSWIIPAPQPAATSTTSSMLFVAATAGRRGGGRGTSATSCSFSSSSRRRTRRRRSIIPSTSLTLTMSSSSSLPSFYRYGGDDENLIPSPPGSGDVSPSRSFRLRPFDAPPADECDLRALRAVFGGSGSGNGGDAAVFVPLSLAGMMVRGRAGRTTTTIFLSEPGSCRDVASAHARYLKGPATDEDDDNNGDDDNHFYREDASCRFSALPVPLPSYDDDVAISLLSRAYSSDVPISKSTLLSFNSLLVNRDGGLFDNIPWSTWSIDPNLKERDAAGNVVISRFAMGKRAAYERLMGKDWRGRSLSLGNLARRVRLIMGDDDDMNVLDGTSPSSSRAMEGGRTRPKARDNDDDDDDNDSAMMLSLAYRLLRVEVREAGMEIAESEQHLAVLATSLRQSSGGGDDIANDLIKEDEVDALRLLEKARDRLRRAEASLREMEGAGDAGRAAAPPPPFASSIFSFVFPWNNPKEEERRRKKMRSKETRSLLSSILDRLVEERNPPYRGAIGYPAKLDSRVDIIKRSALPYSSPYELLLEIIEEQLNSKIVGCVLEPASLLEGNLVLGGALLLKRKGVPKSTNLLGEVISYTDDDDTLGNEGVLPRSMYVVECFSDEAVGMAIASGMHIFVEEEIYNRAGGMSVKLDFNTATSVRASVTDRVPPVCPADGSYNPQVEGERVMSEMESHLLRVPMTTIPRLYDGPNQSSNTSLAGRSASAFSTFVPVRSLDEYDALSDDAKTRLLLKLESFRGFLPRPRAVRSSSKVASQDYLGGMPTPSILDEILLPLIDESVRRQYNIRDAERRGDFEGANALRSQASSQYVALERARRAREDGLVDEALRMEEEAELYRSLRADTTQDELAYSRYLDRDEWYERETRERIKRLDKSKFGTLLDGVDLP